jgi:hypothetical protein
MPKSLQPSYREDTDHFVHVLDHLFVPAIKKAGFEPIRPKIEGAEVIHAQIIKNIEQSELVLCDMSALNPNVFFEIGIRTAVDKPACMVVDDITNNIPFDIGIVNYHTYKSCIDPWVLSVEIDKLVSHILATKETSERNSLWRYFGLSTRAHFSDKETGIEAKVDLMSMRLDGLARQLSDRDRTYKKGVGSADRDRQMINLFNGLSEIARNAGFAVFGGSGSDDKMTISINGKLPDHVEAEMMRLATDSNFKLSIETVPAIKK